MQQISEDRVRYVKQMRVLQAKQSDHFFLEVQVHGDPDTMLYFPLDPLSLEALLHMCADALGVSIPIDKPAVAN